MRQKAWTFLLVGSLVALMGGSTVSASEIWEQWRGAERTGETGNVLPASLGSLDKAWRVELGKGYPGPIVANDRVFVVETVDGGDARVRALALADGRQLWETTWKSSGSVPFFAKRNGDWVRSTPAWDGQRLYVGDMQEVLVALDGKTGEEVWRIDFPAKYESKVPPFGFASSPMVDGKHVYVQAADSMVKLNGSDGSVIWRSLASDTDIMSGGAFSSPAMATIDGEKTLLVQTRLTLNGLDPETGEVWWKHDVPSFRGMNILTPMVFGKGVFTSTYRNNSFYYRVGDGEAGGAEAVQAWTNPASAYMSSPIIIGNHAYVHLGNGRVDCIDLSSGESAWRTGESYGDYWSMIHGRDTNGKPTILALNEAGELFLVDPDPAAFSLREKREIADQETWGHVAVADGRIFVRELSALSVWKFNAAERNDSVEGASSEGE